MPPWSWSSSILRMFERVAHWSRRRPVTQRVEPVQDLHQRADLAHVAAGQTQRHRLVEHVDAVLADQRLELAACPGKYVSTSMP